MAYVWAFVVGGAICVVGQLLLDLTSLTPARILTGYVVAGVALSALGLYGPAGGLCGQRRFSVPLLGFGHLLAQGVRQAVARAGAAGLPDRRAARPGAAGIAASLLWRRGVLPGGQKPRPELTRPHRHTAPLFAPSGHGMLGPKGALLTMDDTELFCLGAAWAAGRACPACLLGLSGDWPGTWAGPGARLRRREPLRLAWCGLPGARRWAGSGCPNAGPLGPDGLLEPVPGPVTTKALLPGGWRGELCSSIVSNQS